MKLQVAIDRVDMLQARSIVAQVADAADIVEIGTSLTKEYGLRALTRLTEDYGGQVALLADIKTCDEGRYEFDLGYDCAAAAHRGTMMIDLLECDDARIERIGGFVDAVYCLHTSVDSGATADPVGQVRAFRERFPQIRRIAVAGGIKPDQLAGLAVEGVEIAIMGSAITKADDIAAAARRCKELAA